MKSQLFLFYLALWLANDLMAQQTPPICYAPTHSNVSYQSVLDLPVSSPTEIISYGESEFQFGEYWKPRFSNPDSKQPLVVLIHGGCWLNSFDVKHTHALSTALSESGYAVLALEYRRTGDAGGGWPGSYYDIRLALASLDTIMPDQVDRNRIAVVGHSAGGHLALLHGSEHQSNGSIKAVIGLAPIVDLVSYSKGEGSCQQASVKFMGGDSSQHTAAYKAATVKDKTLHPNSFILQGDMDHIVSPEQAKSAKTDNLLIIKGAGHFDMVHPYTQSFSELLKLLAKTL